MFPSRFGRPLKLWPLVVGAGILSASALGGGVAAAQGTPAPQQSLVSNSGRLRVEPGNAGALLGLEQRRDVRAVELELTQAQLRQFSPGWEALSRWVSRGGVVLLHSDAAQLFGFRTVAARERTRERAGQRFGRARASLPFGAHPLLWGGVSQTLEGRGRGAMGVYLVYYQLQAGDQLVVSQGAGVPLLSVTDLSASTEKKPDQTPLYAAMLAPYGQGWALVLPRTLEARADGPTFARNLDQFVADLPQTNSSADAWTSVSASAIETAHRQKRQGRAVEWEELALALRAALAPLPPKQWPSSRLPAVGAWQNPTPATPRAPEAPDETTDETAATSEADEAAAEQEAPAKPDAPTAERLLMRRSEAAALSQVFERATGKGEGELGALLEQLAGRLALQRGQAPGSQVPDVARNPQWFSDLIALDGQRRQSLAPTREVNGEQEPPSEAVLQLQLWNGVFAATAAHAFGVDARRRAAAWREALHWWNLALEQPLEPLEIPQKFEPDAVLPPLPAFAPVGQKNDSSLGSLPFSVVRRWQQMARWEFQKAVHDAPMTLRWQGPHGEQNTISMYPVDAALTGIPAPIEGNEYPPSNSFRWRVMQRTIEIIDDRVRYDMGWGADQVEVRLRPEPWFATDFGAGALDWDSLVSDEDVSLANGQILFWSSPSPLPDEMSGIKIPKGRKTYQEYDPADPYGVVYTRKPLQRSLQEKRDAIAKLDARSKSPTNQVGIEKQLQYAQDDYFRILNFLFSFQEMRARTTPFYLTRLHRTSLIEALTQGGSPVPEWLQEGLANLACLDVANSVVSQGIYPDLPSELQHTHPNHETHFDWQRDVLRATETYKPVVNLMKGNALNKYDSINYGPPLAKMPTTHQVQFFYEQFGRGAVVETLQRLGAGQSIDEALRATTGLNQREFFDRWRRWENTAPTAPTAPSGEAVNTTSDQAAPATADLPATP